MRPGRQPRQTGPSDRYWPDDGIPGIVPKGLQPSGLIIYAIMTMSNSLSPRKDHPIRALVLDMDGVLWRDTQPIGNLAEIFARIGNIGLKVAFVTNNATQNTDQYVKKLASFGVSVAPDCVVTSASATAEYLRGRFPEGGPVFIIGEQGLIDTLADYGFYAAQEEDPPLAVISSLDRQLTYAKLRRAAHFINSGVLFLATNADRALPTPEGLIPGAGSILAALERATAQKARVMGKPAPDLFELALRKLEVQPAEAVAVGDQLETDMAAGRAAGCRAALVLSGVTSQEQARAANPPPDWIEPDLATFIDRLNKHT